MTTRHTMLEIAREAIVNRARYDGYDEGEYNPMKDDEGYSISLLAALRHWSHEHGHDFQEELRRSHQLFQEDLDETCTVQLSEPK